MPRIEHMARERSGASRHGLSKAAVKNGSDRIRIGDTRSTVSPDHACIACTLKPCNESRAQWHPTRQLTEARPDQGRGEARTLDGAPPLCPQWLLKRRC